MFKAKLIQHKGFYQLRSQQLWLGLIPLLFIGLITSLYDLPTSLVLVFIAIYLITTFFIFRNRRQMNALSNSSTLDMNTHQISILNTLNGAKEIISLADVTRIIVKKQYSLPQETLSDLKNEAMGKANEQFIILHQGDKIKRLDFEIDTHFKITQLNKLIEAWQQQGYSIEKQ